MQNTETLINLGFERYPIWDYDDPITKHYRKEMNGKVFRAYEFTCNGPVYVIMGELSLDGTILPVKGVLPIAILAKESGFKGFILPNEKKQAVSYLSKFSNLTPTILEMTEKETISIAEEILRVQKEGGFGTIVIGRRGVSRTEEFLYGSVSTSVMHKARVGTIWVVE